MSGPAKVRSTEAIEDFRGSLSKFELRAQNALDTLLAELRRAMQWLEHDCPAMWQKEVKSAEDGVHQAKLELDRCLLFSLEGERPACREQRAALKGAKERLEYCRGKREIVKKWVRQLHEEQFECEARLGQMQRLIELDLPTARARLQAIVRRIDEYQVELAPQGPTRPSTPVNKPTEQGD